MQRTERNFDAPASKKIDRLKGLPTSPSYSRPLNFADLYGFFDEGKMEKANANKKTQRR